MGAVFRATHLGTERTVALKVIVPDRADQSDFIMRFEREARACGRLRHPNIVDVTDFGYDEGSDRRLAYLVMEYLDGCSLADVLRDDATLPIAWVVDILQQTGSAVEEAHRAGILHRDLKPDNIWLEPNRRGGFTVKVLDFGLARFDVGNAAARAGPSSSDLMNGAASGLSEGDTLVRGTPNSAPKAPPPAEDDATLSRPSVPTTATVDHAENATHMGAIVGTPAYMSPEQCRGLPLTAHSDVYSLAVIAYRLLSGVLPFSGTADALLVAHVSKTPRPVRELRPELPKEAGALLMRGLAKNPASRPASAGAFTEMLSAKAQTTAAFFEEGMFMFLHHARAFLSASVLGLSPVLVLGLFSAANALAFVYGTTFVPRAYGLTFVTAAVLMTVGPGILLLQGAVVPAVMQAIVAPLQPIDVKTLGQRFRPRLRAYVRAVFPLMGLFVFAGLWQIAIRPLVAALVGDDGSDIAIWRVLAVVLIPNAPQIAMIAYLARTGSARSLQLFGAVAVVEGLAGKQAIKRCSELNAGGAHIGPLRALLVGLGVTIGVVGSLGFVILSRWFPKEVAIGSLGILFALSFVVFAPFVSVISALTYLRARRALGEPLDRALADFERAVLPESHWRLGARGRVATLIESRR